MKNNDIRIEAFSKGIKLYEIAEKLGIHDSNFSRKLRTELSEVEKCKVRQIINQIVVERGN